MGHAGRIKSIKADDLREIRPEPNPKMVPQERRRCNPKQGAHGMVGEHPVDKDVGEHLQKGGAWLGAEPQAVPALLAAPVLVNGEIAQILDAGVRGDAGGIPAEPEILGHKVILGQVIRVPFEPPKGFQAGLAKQERLPHNAVRVNAIIEEEVHGRVPGRKVAPLHLGRDGLWIRRQGKLDFRKKRKELPFRSKFFVSEGRK